MAKNPEVIVDVKTVRVAETRTVEKIGNSFLIEYRDGDDLKRVILPEPVSGEIELDFLEMGVPYGIDWNSIIKPAFPTGADFGRELRRRGVWTAADAMTRVGEVYSAIQSVYGIDLAAVLNAASKNEEA